MKDQSMLSRLLATLRHFLMVQHKAQWSPVGYMPRLKLVTEHSILHTRKGGKGFQPSIHGAFQGGYRGFESSLPVHKYKRWAHNNLYGLRK